jgi:purine-binding chemotaxis protein CheW
MSDDTTTRQLVVFSLGEEEYALPIGRVQEILFYTSPRPVSSGEPWVTGVISLRGKIIAVYDLAARLGVVREQASQAKIVIVEAGADRAGIVVDDVAEVLTVADADLEELPSATEHELLQSIAKVGDRLVILLDLDHLVAGGVAPEAASAPALAAAGA